MHRIHSREKAAGAVFNEKRLFFRRWPGFWYSLEADHHLSHPTRFLPDLQRLIRHRVAAVGAVSVDRDLLGGRQLTDVVDLACDRHFAAAPCRISGCDDPCYSGYQEDKHNSLHSMPLRYHAKMRAHRLYGCHTR